MWSHRRTRDRWMGRILIFISDLAAWAGSRGYCREAGEDAAELCWVASDNAW